MEFLSLYSLQMNRVVSAMLRLTEIEDILRQLSHLTRKDLISLADLPRFLTMELNVRLAAIPTLVHTLDALKSGFAAIIQPLVDYEYQHNKKLQVNLLFTLPEISSSQSLCTIEQLRPIMYRYNGHCFGGPIPFDDLLLLTCDKKRYLLRAPELDKCFQDNTTILCPGNLLHTVQQLTCSGYLGRHHRRLLSNNFIRLSHTVVIYHPCYYLVAVTILALGFTILLCIHLLPPRTCP